MDLWPNRDDGDNYDDETSLWNELNHQHTKEIQRHISNVDSSYNPRFSERPSSIQSAFQQTVSAFKTGIGRAVAPTTVFDSTHSSAFEGQPVSRGPLAEFGLDSTHAEWESESESRFNNINGSSSSVPLLSYVDRPLSGNGNDDNNFLVLNRFSMAPKNEGWGAVSDFDQFYTSLYSYYYHRGLIPLVCKGVVEILSLFFSLWLSVFFFAYLDWKQLWKCTDEASCQHSFQSYITNPFHQPSLWNFMVIVYILLFSVYGIFSIQAFVRSIRSAVESRYIFEEKLGISPRKLEGGAVEWHEVVESLSKLQSSGEYRIAVSGETIDPLIVAQRIMRRENFIIALFNVGLLDCSISLAQLCPTISKRFQMPFYSKTLEWCIYICILNYMFNFKYRIRPSFYMNPPSLKRRFIVCGIIHAVFMPFILFFMVIYFYFQYSYDLRSTRQYFGRREWSRLALWEFREFNELQHIFDRRLGPSYDAADDYLQLFTQSSIMHAFGRALMFLSGSLAAVLLSFAAINDAILLHVKLGQWNLLWYVGIMGAAYSFGKGLLPDLSIHPKYQHNLFADMNTALAKVTKHTHFLPNHWKDRGWDESVKASFSRLFEYKTKLFLFEIVSVLLAPIILCYSLPKRADDICSFIQQVKIEVPGIGDICGFSSFDLDTFKDETYEEMDSENQHTFKYPKAQLEKVSNSFINFTLAYPTWRGSSTSKQLLDQIDSLRREQAAATQAEQVHHLEAVQRQLETLKRMELFHAETSPQDYVHVT